MNIPQNIKELYQADSVPKNLRIHFPNRERQDITNENIIAESVSLTESLCSQNELKFGLCEAAVFECEIFNIYENLKGYDIEVTQEIGGYSVPYGKFKIESCKKQSNMSKRRLIAYDALKSDRLDKSALSAFNDFMTRYNTPYLSTDFISAINYMSNRMGVKLEYPHEVISNTVSTEQETLSVTYLSTTTYSLTVDYNVYSFQNIAELAHAYLGFDIPLSIVNESEQNLKDGVKQEPNPFISEADMIKHLLGKDVIILCDTTAIPISDISSVITHGASTYKIGFATQAYVRDAKTTENYFTHMLFYGESPPIPIEEFQKLILPIHKISELYFFTAMQPKQITEEFTYRTFFQSMFELMGGFGGISRDGNLRMFDVGAVIVKNFVSKELSPLQVAKSNSSAATVGEYALFAGGDIDYTSSTIIHDNISTNTVDSYNKDLVHATQTVLAKARGDMAALSFDAYALFAGGVADSGGNKRAYTNNVDAYSVALVRTSRTALPQAKTVACARTKKNALFAGGNVDGKLYANVTSYNTSLTQASATSLSEARQPIGATVGEYALFAGGVNLKFQETFSSVVDAYGASLVRSTPIGLTEKRECAASATVGDYALFVGGASMGNELYGTESVDAYNASLVRSTPMKLSKKATEITATTVSDKALFYLSGGFMNAYTKSLIREEVQIIKDGAVPSSSATTIGKYAIFAGGFHFVFGKYERIDNAMALSLETTSTTIKETEITEAIQKGSTWYDDYTVKEFGKIQIVQKNALAYEYIGNEEAENVYVIKDNWMVENFDLSANYLDIVKNLYDKIGYTTYVPMDAEIKGLPYLEVGDRVCIKSKNGDIHTLILRRDLKGVQALVDSYEANGNEINEAFKED